MAYSTTDLVGLMAYAKSIAKGKYYFEGIFEEKKTVQTGVEIGKLKGSMVADDGNTVLAIDDANYGTLYYLNRKIYLKDGFGNRLESNDNEEWEIVAVETIDDTIEDPIDSGWGNSLPAKNTGIIGGIRDVVKKAGDLIKNAPNGNDPSLNNTNTQQKSSSNVVKYIIIAAIAGLVILIIFLLVKTPKQPEVQQMMQVAKPQSDVPNPVLSGLPKRY